MLPFLPPDYETDHPLGNPKLSPDVLLAHRRLDTGRRCLGMSASVSLAEPFLLPWFGLFGGGRFNTRNECCKFWDFEQTSRLHNRLSVLFPFR